MTRTTMGATRALAAALAALSLGAAAAHGQADPPSEPEPMPAAATPERMRLLAFTDTAGVWDARKQVIAEMVEHELQALVDGRHVVGGMLTKIRAVQFALAHGINQVRILNAADANRALWTDRIGTTCLREGWVRYPPELVEYYAAL